MHDATPRNPKTKWLDLLGDRADLGRSICRLSRLAVAAHLAAAPSADGPADVHTGRLVNVATPGDASRHTEVPR